MKLRAAQARGRARLPMLIALLTAAACAGREDTELGAPTVALVEVVTPGEAALVFDSVWSRVAHTYHDPTFGGLDWDAVRTELRPEALHAGTADSLRSVLETMLSRLGDSHFGIIPASVADALDPDSIDGGEGDPGDIGIELRVLDGQLVVSRVREGSAAQGAGVRTGWTIRSIGTTPAESMLSVLDVLPGDRRLAQAQVAAAAMRRLSPNVDDSVQVRFGTRGDTVTTVTLVGRPIPGTPVRFGNLPTMFADLRWREIPLASGGCAGYIAFDVWMTAILPAFEQAFLALRHCDGTVLDLRGNPGGVAGMVMGVSGYFFDERVPLGRFITRQGALNLVAMPRRATLDGSPMTPSDGALALLTDGMSMSTSELFAAGLQESGRARVFGDTSGGQALPALMTRLPNQDVLMYAFANLLTPDGVRIEGRGVIPDVPIPLRRLDLLEGRDPALEAALDWIGTHEEDIGAEGARDNHDPASAGEGEIP